MRQSVYIQPHATHPGFDAYGRDITWLNERIFDELAAAKIRGDSAIMLCCERWSAGNGLRLKQLYELATENPDIALLADQLEDEYGEEYFLGRPKSKLFHVRAIEDALENKSLDAKERAALLGRLFELNGWTIKPLDKSTEITVNAGNAKIAEVKLNTNDPREAERIVMSIFGSI